MNYAMLPQVTEKRVRLALHYHQPKYQLLCAAVATAILRCICSPKSHTKELLRTFSVTMYHIQHHSVAE